MFGGKSKHIKTLPLQFAVLCVDCEMIAEPIHDACPVCGGRSLILLARALGQLMDVERIARLDVESDSAAYSVKALVEPAEADEAPPVPA